MAEFWADGPDSETPPGHWFTILNTINDHPNLEKKWRGKGKALSDLEWDVKAYFTLAAAMHDAAITTWSIKGYYDYIRPISSIRYMAEKGQCSNKRKANYHVHGLPLINGLIEDIKEDDPLAEVNPNRIGKIKVRRWRGPNYITSDSTAPLGVDWILAEEWWPYQRPSFVTPPFAGYVSGHSVFSKTAAEILTTITGDPFFPGGLGSFSIPANVYLAFERGPSVDMELQWATYRDAADQTSLSRIWGGIHPPIDDLPGREIGSRVAACVLSKMNTIFVEEIINSLEKESPVFSCRTISKNTLQIDGKLPISCIKVQDIHSNEILHINSKNHYQLKFSISEKPGIYLIKILSRSVGMEPSTQTLKALIF